MQMLEHVAGETPNRMHRDIGENRIAHLREQRHGDPQNAITKGQRQRRGEKAGKRQAGGIDQRIGRPFERKRHRYGDELRRQQ